jgi:uncharacterized protein (DUF362 family)
VLKHLLRFYLLWGLAHLAPAQQQEALPPSTIYFTRHPDAVLDLEENPAVVARMVEQLVIAATGRPDAAQGWRSLVSPQDRVGIKVSAAGGRYFSTHQAVVNAIVAGLESAGIPRSRVIVWDRDPEKLAEAQFVGRPGNYQVRSISGPKDYDRKATVLAPVLGRLIWGDALFEEKQRKTFGEPLDTSSLLSSTSHIATVLSREVTKVINVPVLSDEAECGVAGAIYNMTIPNLDNWRRFTQPGLSGPESLAEVYADENMGPKVVLHIMDGLVAQYAHGPRGNGNYAFAHKTLYVSKDPVALDAHAFRLIGSWRVEAKLPRMETRADWLRGAADMGLGQFDPARIRLQPVALPR